MNEFEHSKNTEMITGNDETNILHQEDIDSIFDKITEKTEIIMIKNINPKSDYEKKKDNGIYINLYNYVLKGSINLSLLPKKMDRLKWLIIQDVPLKKLDGLPIRMQSLETFSIRRCPLETLKYLPESLPNLNRFVVTSCNLSNLKHFPQNVPYLKEIWLHDNQITSLKGLPPNLPNIKKIHINNNNLTSLKYLPKFKNGRIPYINLQNNPLRTLFNMNQTLLQKFLDYKYHTLFTLSPRGRQLIDEYRVPFIDENDQEAFYIYPKVLKKISTFYSKPISEIAEKYIRSQIHQEPISEDDLDRLIWEADLEDRKFLETNLPNPTKDPILNQINQRLTIPIPSNFTLFQ
uniref:Leucine Rich repeats (2 copies) n=1 Tax=Promethearchaeum syntrophicum TaxID=2594042 RepID=A0A5B9DAI8_9ARCH|nr:leucine-rich repeat domain-containing protein [Candidatus Prometheoarchaeum syntrophicum]QEE16134.1 Leucine Rich repeats (2 copies) [Candidatus Prometheoarchaeum syntrophicum]